MRGQNGTAVTMTTNGKNKAVETKICILGGPGVGKSGMFVSDSLSVLLNHDSLVVT